MNHSEFSASAGQPRSFLRGLLEQVLAHESQLAASAHRCEWRVRGSPLLSAKRLFAEQGRQVDHWLGNVREVARRVGVAVVGAPEPAPEVGEDGGPRAAAKELVCRHEALARELREAVAALNDRDPAGDATLLLNGLLDFHETSAWMLRLLLDAPERARVV